VITILGVISEEERGYVQKLRELIPGVKLELTTRQPGTLAELHLIVKMARASGCFVTVPEVARLAVPDAPKFTQDDFAGSCVQHNGIDYLVMNDLSQIVKTTTGRHLAARYLSKLTSPEAWPLVPEFRYELCSDPDKAKAALEFLSSADFIAYDIETVKQHLFFDVISFTGVFLAKRNDPEGKFKYSTRTYAFPHSDEVMQVLIQKVLELPIPKITQNGKYDNAYLLRWGMPPSHWYYDTAHFFHSWYAEMPKRLDFITIYSLRDVSFWKDEGSGSFTNRAKYCGRDSWATACTMMTFLERAPQWAFQNYIAEFKTAVACVLPEHTGLCIDREAEGKLREYNVKVAEKARRDIAESVGIANFNPGSWQQVLKLVHGLGSTDINSTGPAFMDRFSVRHPLNQWFAESIKEYKSAAKVVSNYVKESIRLTDHAGQTWDKLVYCLNPHGTDTGRLASKEHHFWCGLQIQNIKRDEDDDEAVSVKTMLVAPAGFYLGEADYEQAEARDTAYLSGDTSLISAVDCGKDFHSLNAASFFGVPYEDIYQDLEYIDPDGTVHKQGTKNKPLRNLSKRVNHGANYNMGAGVLLDTMGIRNVIKAKQLLSLPVSWSLLQVCAYLLSRFDATYPVVRGDYQEYIKRCVRQTKLLVGPTGWTRYCFGDPTNNKRDLNSYVAHPSQSLNGMVLNKAWWRIFTQVALVERRDFRLFAQIHDSILFGYRKGREDLAYKVKELMQIPIQVTDPYGITRTLLVPSALKGEGTIWADLKDMR